MYVYIMYMYVCTVLSCICVSTVADKQRYMRKRSTHHFWHGLAALEELEELATVVGVDVARRQLLLQVRHVDVEADLDLAVNPRDALILVHVLTGRQLSIID